MTKPTGKPKGRPRLPDHERLVRFQIRLTPAEAEKLKFLGRAWLTPRLKKVPHPKESNFP